MAEVLGVSPSPPPDVPRFYQSSSGLQRSHRSTTSLFHAAAAAATPPPRSRSESRARSPSLDDDRSSSPSWSVASSSSSPLPSTVDFSDTTSITSTPASSGFSLDSKTSSTDALDFPLYDRVQFFHSDTSFEPRPSSPSDSDEPGHENGADDGADLSATTDTTRSDSPLTTPTVVDDTAVRQEPSRHVDYLSHEWKEEDIWSSWRHIVSQRKVYGQRSRLENASWRTWAKTKNGLPTVSPETLNWLKESDVTWLYGPLKSAATTPVSHETSGSNSRLSKNNSFVATKKPILKKRSMSEVMLQKSLSTTSLVKQAAASVQAQQGTSPVKSDFGRFAVASEAPSRDQIDYFTMTSQSSSASATPCECQEKRHIRFDETVEQCIAVDCKDGDFDDDGDAGSEADSDEAESDSSSDDGVIMMRRKKRLALRRGSSAKSSRSNSRNGRKMVETLPATTLKNRSEDDDGSSDAARHHTFGRDWSSNRLSPSPSQETLRPSHPSRNFLLPEDAAEDAGSSTWSFGVSNPRSSLGASSGVDGAVGRGRIGGTDSPRSTRSSTPAPPSARDEYTPEGMRRTPSGMFMPYDEDEDDAMAVGLFGRVSETINTARDIAHVIWNVGWRN